MIYPLSTGYLQRLSVNGAVTQYTYTYLASTQTATISMIGWVTSCR